MVDTVVAPIRAPRPFFPFPFVLPALGAPPAILDLTLQAIINSLSVGHSWACILGYDISSKATEPRFHRRERRALKPDILPARNSWPRCPSPLVLGCPRPTGALERHHRVASVLDPLLPSTTAQRHTARAVRLEALAVDDSRARLVVFGLGGCGGRVRGSDTDRVGGRSTQFNSQQQSVRRRAYLGDPHLLEGRERRKDRAANPDGVLALRRGDDLGDGRERRT